ncbi:MAG: hypothetical protein PHE26_07945 [Syntrophomonadaceae bacterium]|nr:hypothetical protein [Syntrophomonadaceae bacterium]
MKSAIFLLQLIIGVYFISLIAGNNRSELLLFYDGQIVNERERGTSLLEVLAALAMLALLTTTVLAVFLPAGLWIKRAREETTAANYAAAILEELRDNRSLLQPVKEISPEDLGLSEQYRPDIPHGIEAHITTELINGYSQLYKADVLVMWKEGNQLCKLNMATVIRKDQEVSIEP